MLNETIMRGEILSKYCLLIHDFINLFKNKKRTDSETLSSTLLE